MWIAAAQSPITRDARENGNAVRALMREARQAGAQLIHFPEGALSGYPTFPDQDWSALSEEFDRTAALASQLGIWVVLGANHRLEQADRPRNSLYLISDFGVLKGRYDKRLCSFRETADHYGPGADPFAFDIGGFRFGCCLCIEVNFPELFQEYERMGVDCVLLSAHADDDVYGTLAQAHAATNNFWVSLSTPAGCAGKLPSGLIGPDGRWLSRCAAEPLPGIALARLDRAAPEFDVALNKARPWRRGVRDGRLRPR